jgi:hypothetical protein
LICVLQQTLRVAFGWRGDWLYATQTSSGNFEFYTRRFDLRHNCIILSSRSHLDHEKFIKMCCNRRDALISLGSKLRERYDHNLSLLVVVVKLEHLYPQTAAIYQSWLDSQLSKTTSHRISLVGQTISLSFNNLLRS